MEQLYRESIKNDPKDSMVELQIAIPFELQSHLKFINILGLCAKGENLIAEVFG